MSDGHCATCCSPFEPRDVVPLNGTPEQVQALRERLGLRKARLERIKGGKKRKLALECAPSPPEDSGAGEACTHAVVA